MNEFEREWQKLQRENSSFGDHERYCRFMWKRVHKYGFRTYFFSDLKTEAAYLRVRFPKETLAYDTLSRMSVSPTTQWDKELQWSNKYTNHWDELDPTEDVYSDSKVGREARQNFYDYVDQKLKEFAEKKSKRE